MKIKDIQFHYNKKFTFGDDYTYFKNGLWHRDNEEYAYQTFQQDGIKVKKGVFFSLKGKASSVSYTNFIGYNLSCDKNGKTVNRDRYEQQINLLRKLKIIDSNEE